MAQHQKNSNSFNSCWVPDCRVDELDKWCVCVFVYTWLFMCGSEVHEGLTALRTACHSQSICICARQKKQRSERRGKKKTERRTDENQRDADRWYQKSEAGKEVWAGQDGKDEKWRERQRLHKDEGRRMEEWSAGRMLLALRGHCTAPLQMNCRCPDSVFS